MKLVALSVSGHKSFQGSPTPNKGGDLLKGGAKGLYTRLSAYKGVSTVLS